MTTTSASLRAEVKELVQQELAAQAARIDELENDVTTFRRQMGKSLPPKNPFSEATKRAYMKYLTEDFLKEAKQKPTECSVCHCDSDLMVSEIKGDMKPVWMCKNCAEVV